MRIVNKMMIAKFDNRDEATDDRNSELLEVTIGNGSVNTIKFRFDEFTESERNRLIKQALQREITEKLRYADDFSRVESRLIEYWESLTNKRF